jgi:hypothetical protein
LLERLGEDRPLSAKLNPPKIFWRVELRQAQLRRENTESTD